MSHFLMSPPRVDWAPRGKANFKSRADGEPVAPGAARRDWDTLVAAIREAGGTIAELPAPERDDLTGLPYTAEAGHAVGGKFLLPNLTPVHRQPEAGVIAPFVARLGFETVRVRAKWEGQGDVFTLADGRTIHTWGEGPAARTERAAYEEIRPHFPAPSIAIGFRADPWFHGNTFLGVFRNRLLLCEEALLPGERARLAAFLGNVEVRSIDRAASLAYATNALEVGDTVIAPPGLPPSITSWWESMGLRVRELELPTLFGRGGGAAVCLTNRLSR